MTNATKEIIKQGKMTMFFLTLRPQRQIPLFRNLTRLQGSK